jgi:hypothetical protein
MLSADLPGGAVASNSIGCMAREMQASGAHRSYRAAALYSRQIAQGLDGNPRAALKARAILREMCVGGRIDLKREGEQLWAEHALQPAACCKSSP